MDIATGQAQSHPSVLSLDSSHSPAVAPPVQVASGGGTQMGAADTTGMFQSQAAAGTADCAAAQGAGMSADAARRQFYEQDIAPMGAEYGITMDLPTVPEQVTAPADTNLYGQGNQPGA